MHAHLLQTHTLVRVRHQDLLTEVLRMVAQRVEWPHGIISLLQVQVRNIRIGVLFATACEWSLTRQEFKSEDADGPVVNLRIVGLMVDQLRSYIVDSATESCSSLIDSMCCPSKVTQLDCHGIQVVD